MKSNISRKGLMALIVFASLALIFFEYYPLQYSENDTLNALIKVIVTRAIGCMVFIPLSLYMEYNVFGFTKRKSISVWLCVLVPLAVVLNNLPIVGLFSGNAYLTEPAWFIFVFAIESFMIGLFEEFAFRGVLFPYILQTRRYSSQAVFWATVISSSAFGALHFFNLLAGGSVGGVMLQVGYSFLIGGMCAIVLLYTRCIWICVALHAIYDFCGFLVPTLGTGIIWDPITVTVTIIIGVFAFTFMCIRLLKITPETVAELYNKNEEASF